MKIIVNADDFGKDESSTKAIMECFRLGVISQTTCMINMPFFNEGLEMAREEGLLERLGLHINLSEGKPLSEGIRNSRIFCGQDGYFNKGVRGNKFWRFWLPSQEKIWVADEIRAQMKAFNRLSLPMRHFDSHGYVCTYLPILPIALAIGKENGFRTTRGWVNTSSDGEDGRMSFLRKLYVRSVSKKIQKSGLIAADYLGFAWDWPKIKALTSDSTIVEIHCHPNYRDIQGKFSLSGELMDWLTPYEESFKILAELRNLNIQFSTFAQL